jgi:DNA primase
LDPGEPAEILDCRRVALHLKDLFNAFNLESFVKVTGSKGLHLIVPLNCDVTYEMTQPFAKALAELASRQMPDRIVSEMAKARRGGRCSLTGVRTPTSKQRYACTPYAQSAKSRSFRCRSVGRSCPELQTSEMKSSFFTPDAALKRIRRVGDLDLDRPGMARAYAELLGDQEGARLLQTTLEEERQFTLCSLRRANSRSSSRLFGSTTRSQHIHCRNDWTPVQRPLAPNVTSQWRTVRPL